MSTRMPHAPISWTVPATVGVAHLALAIEAGRQAATHMQTLGVICGQSASVHCGWCGVAIASSLAAAAALAWAARSASRP